MLVCGLDEAGRGSIVGPLIVGGIAVEESSISDLASLGVKDSKLLSPRKREALYGGIVGLCHGVVALPIPTWEIDYYVTHGKKLRKLNYLEAIYMAKAVDRLSPQLVYADASDTVARRFSEDITRNMKVSAKVIAEHHADSNYPVVSAASIIAKVVRDRTVQEPRERFGDFGSGYPSDWRTIEFLRRWIEREGLIPRFCRSSWHTWLRIAQLKLNET